MEDKYGYRKPRWINENVEEMEEPIDTIIRCRDLATEKFDQRFKSKRDYPGPEYYGVKNLNTELERKSFEFGWYRAASSYYRVKMNKIHSELQSMRNATHLVV